MYWMNLTSPPHFLIGWAVTIAVVISVLWYILNITKSLFRETEGATSGQPPSVPKSVPFLGHLDVPLRFLQDPLGFSHTYVTRRYV